MENKIIAPMVADHPLANGLMHWWMAGIHGMGVGSTRWYDLCNNDHLALQNYTIPDDWNGGVSRPGGWGSLNHVLSSNSFGSWTEPSFTTNKLVLSAWVWPRSNVQYGGVIGTRSSSNTGLIKSSTTANMTLMYNNSGFNDQKISTPLSEWTWVCASSDTGIIRYAGWNASGGWQENSVSKTVPNINLSGTWAVGKEQQSSARTWNGYLDDIQMRAGVVYNFRQMKALFQESVAGYPNLISRYNPVIGKAPVAGGPLTPIPHSAREIYTLSPSQPVGYF